MATICIKEHTSGSGAIAGGAGELGQASASATGAAATGYGYPVIEIAAGVDTSLTVQLTSDLGGTVADPLTGITSVKLVLRGSMDTNVNALEITCTFDSDGKVTVPFTAADTADMSGLWCAEFLCYTSTTLKKSFRAYVAIRKSMASTDNIPAPLTIMDVRLALMDTDASANQLIDDLEFSDMMIINCIMRAIAEWNETPPTLAQQFDATNFPYREHLLKGTVGYLLQMVAYRYLRNQMRFSASGFSTDTNDKGPQYLQLASAALAEWKTFVAAKKTEHNMLECFGVVSMPEFG